jgi:hypothetical protein
MADKGWKNKEDKVPRRSPRKRGKMCNRPFKAPRRVADVESQVQIITEAQNTREIFCYILALHAFSLYF